MTKKKANPAEADIAIEQLPDGRRIAYAVRPGVVLQTLPDGNHTGVSNLEWAEAQDYLGTGFSPREQRCGWPKMLSHFQLGNLQFPVEHPGDTAASNEASRRQWWVSQTLQGLCERGHMGYSGRRPPYGDYLIAPQTFLAWLTAQGLSPSRLIAAWCKANGVEVEGGDHATQQKEPRKAAETAEERQARRWQLCVKAGLDMPTDTYKQLPRGIGEIAKKEGITRQAFAEDLRKHRERLAQNKNGR